MFRQLTTLIVAHLVLANSIKGVHTLEAPRINIPDQGTIGGTYLKMFRVQNIKAYLGIPYAKADRFSVPDVTPIQWPGILNANTYGPQCWQKSSQVVDEQTKRVFELLQGDSKVYGNSSAFDENCLNLNIFIPDGPPGSKGYAVVVWIPGRDFSSGSALDIDPFQLVFKQKVIVITISYRLSIFGFLTTGDGEATGNYGLMDQSAALFWIQKNIHHFGGNSNNGITIMGAAAGAISVGLHLTSDQWSSKAFHKAVMMSGNPITENVVKSPKELTKHLDLIANMFGCNRTPTSLLIKCLRRVDPKVLIENIPDVDWGPIVDNGLDNRTLPFIRDKPINLFKNGSYHRVPVLLGITDMEDVLYLKDDDPNSMITSEDFKHFLSDVAYSDMTKLANNESDCDNFNIASDALFYMYQTDNINMSATEKFVNFNTDRRHIAPLHMLADILSAENDVYTYIFKVRPKTTFYNLDNYISVPKYFDQIYVWGVPYMNNTRTVESWNMSDKKITDIVMTMWANFFKASDPVKANVYLKWSSYSMSKRDILMIDENFTLNIFLNNHVLYFWNSYYPKLLENAINCCNLRNNAQIILFPQLLYVFLIVIYLLL